MCGRPRDGHHRALVALRGLGPVPVGKGSLGIGQGALGVFSRGMGQAVHVSPWVCYIHESLSSAECPAHPPDQHSHEQLSLTLDHHAWIITDCNATLDWHVWATAHECE